MCGIFGIVYRNGTTVPDAALLAETGRILGHRGPDSEGVFGKPGIGLVHTRLSLLDLSSRSDQPFWDPQRRYALVYNGEIYNFRELRSELEAKGVVFRTSSDTEVLLHGIIQYGADAIVPRLEGMFAFALWDSEEQKLLLVRDRFGIKPLSIYEDDGVLVFASEIKAILPWIRARTDLAMVSAYLAGFGGPTRGRSFFCDVAMQSPGTIRELRRGQRSTERSFFHITEFWNQADRERLSKFDSKGIVDHFDEMLLASVKKHLIADAPVGALCSGGIDSSLVMAMASKFHSNLAIFHANVKGPLSEYEAAKSLSKHLHLDMRTIDVEDEDFIKQVPAVTWHYEYPFYRHPNSVPFLLVSRLVRASGVKAILSGEGSDECFLGYGPIAFEDLRQLYRRLLVNLRGLVHRVPKLGKAFWPHEPDNASVVEGMQQNFEIALDLVRIQERIQQVGVAARPRDYRSLEWLGYHLRTVLHRNDSLGMAASIEARFPYLDHDFVRAAVNMPYAFKIRPSVTSFDRAHPLLRDKWVIRKVADRYIPRALSQRKKLGFPVNAYERMQVSPDLFRRGFVAHLYQLDERALLHLLRSANRLFQVRLLMLEVWGRMFFHGATEPAMTQDLLRYVTIDPLPA